MLFCSPHGSEGIIAELSALVVGLREVSAEEGDERGVGIDQGDASSHHWGIGGVAEDPPGTPGVPVVDDTGEEELNIQHLDNIIRLIIIIYFNLRT